jgi:hypothetical protein
MRLGFAAERVLCPRAASPVFSKWPAKVALHAASNSLVIARGWVGMYLVIPRGKIGIDQGRASQVLPFFVFQRSAAILRLRSMAKPPIWAHR